MFDIIFFFKQKTAYEVRISDWSSDVCSSDLLDRRGAAVGEEDMGERVSVRGAGGDVDKPLRHFFGRAVGVVREDEQIGRASCRERVFSTCRSRWSPYH